MKEGIIKAIDIEIIGATATQVLLTALVNWVLFSACCVRIAW